MRHTLIAATVAAVLVAAPGWAQQAGNEERDKVMQRMQSQMEKLRSTADPAERQKLMQEHLATLQKAMSQMRGMGGSMMGSDMMRGGMMGGGMMGGNMMGGGMTGGGMMGGGM